MGPFFQGSDGAKTETCWAAVLAGIRYTDSGSELR